MKDDVIFRYINGRIVPIKVNKDKTTSQYMNDKIRNKKNKEKEYTLYHGSPNDFNEFDDDKIGSQSLGGLTYDRGHYFTPEKFDIWGKHVYKVKVSLRKPFIVNENDWSQSLTDLGYNWYDSLRPDVSDFLSEKGYDGTVITTYNDKIAEVVVYSNKDKKIKIVNKE